MTREELHAIEDAQAAEEAIIALRKLRRNPQALAEALHREHRTNQQIVGGVLIDLIQRVGSGQWGKDARNEAFVQVCDAFVDEFQYILPFPYI